MLGREEHRDLIFPLVGTKPYVYTESATPGSEFSDGQQCLIEFPVSARRRWVLSLQGGVTIWKSFFKEATIGEYMAPWLN